MKILIAASPFATLSARRACDIAAQAWASVRPDDSLIARPVSDGRPNTRGFSGLHEVIGGVEVAPSEVDYSLCAEDSAGVARACEATHMWRSDSSALIDCTLIARLRAGEQAQACAMSSDFLGAELLWAKREGLSEVIIALPALSDIDDLGRGMLSVLSGVPLPSSAVDESDFLIRAVAAAREKLGAMRLVVLAADAQRLTGFSGVARAHMRYGLDSQVAQDLDARIGEYADFLVEAYEKSLGSSLFLSANESPSPRGEYAGVGGGLAFVIQCLGGALYSVGDLTVRSRLSTQIRESDLVVYVSGAIEADLPSGLLAALDIADNEPPVVLVYDYGAIAKGELKQLGLSGAYELRPHLSFLERTSPSDSDESAGQDLEEALTQRIATVARTWGW